MYIILLQSLCFIFLLIACYLIIREQRRKLIHKMSVIQEIQEELNREKEHNAEAAKIIMNGVGVKVETLSQLSNAYFQMEDDSILNVEKKNTRIIMKRLVIILLVLIGATSLSAQTPGNNNTDKRQSFIMEGNDLSIDFNTWRPFNDEVGYAVYGSRFRKAKTDKTWGIVLSCAIAPAAGLFTAYAIDQIDGYGWAIVGGAAFVGGLATGVTLWTKGRREMDLMLDDYVKRYGPKTNHASLSAGPTASGIGLALNF